MSLNNSIKFLENIKQGFKRTVGWNKYISEITVKPKNNNLDYIIDPTVRNVNRLLVLLFKNSDNDPPRNSFYKFYIPLVKNEDFNTSVDNKSFFDQHVKNKQEAYENFLKC